MTSLSHIQNEIQPYTNKHKDLYVQSAQVNHDMIFVTRFNCDVAVAVTNHSFF